MLSPSSSSARSPAWERAGGAHLEPCAAPAASVGRKERSILLLLTKYLCICIYIRNQIKILQRNAICCQKVTAASAIFFFFKSKFTFFSSGVSHVCRQGTRRMVVKKAASDFSLFFVRFDFLRCLLEEIPLGSLLFCRCFLFLSPDSSDISWPLSWGCGCSQGCVFCLCPSGQLTQELHHLLLLSTAGQQGKPAARS